jgi:hypothetical protein
MRSKKCLSCGGPIQVHHSGHPTLKPLDDEDRCWECWSKNAPVKFSRKPPKKKKSKRRNVKSFKNTDERWLKLKTFTPARKAA